MLTTPELRNQFDRSFTRIMKTLSPDLQKKWNGVITWSNEHSYPNIQPEIIQQLPPAAKAVYVSLLNKLSRGRL